MKNYIKILVILLFVPLSLISQEREEIEGQKEKEQLERPAFESAILIDTQTDVLYKKNVLEIQMGHRFGLINGGENDLGGIWAPSNIRLGATYSVHERITIGFGTTKFNRLQDFNWKVALLRQTRSNKIPLNITYYGNFTIDARKKENFNNLTDRYSFFNQLIFSKRINPKLSVQCAPSWSHYNAVVDAMRNDMISVSLGGRYKISDQTAILVDYSQPITKIIEDNPHPGISFGVEFATSAHAFQLIISNYNGIVPQKNAMFNQNDFFNGDFLIGFNITRLYHF